ncbi:hypothetical protein [Methanolobus sp.]|uniref:hypothetical protein n=1 Tax=Methanolobus sp. TaxID=1874737 RepID=UPI0025CEAF35|nr:hypothetical protein [Methanolobus sp.]
MNLVVGIISLVFIILQVASAMGSPVTSIDENIGEDEFYSMSYTNPESIEMHEMARQSEDGKHSSVKLNDELTPRTTVSPDGNCSVFYKIYYVNSDMGIEDYALSKPERPREVRIKDISTMGCYAVAFSPDSRMYAAPKLVHLGDGRNAQYALDIMSVDSNELIHRELLPFYKENTKHTPMEWNRAEMYGVYWSEDGSSIVYDVLGADIDGGLYPTTLVTNRLNVNYTGLREMNGYEDSREENAEFSGYDDLMESYRKGNEESGEQIMNAPQNEQANESTDTEDAQPVASLPGFGILIAAAALIIGTKWKKDIP